MKKEIASIHLDGKKFDCPVIVGSEKEKAIDITSLRSQTGYVSFDPGFANTASTKSAITFLDGEEGILRYRGYSVDELSEKLSFLEVAWLLFYGEVPEQDKKFLHFKDKIFEYTPVIESVLQTLEALPPQTHPMAMLSIGVTTLSSCYQQKIDPLLDSENQEDWFPFLVAQIATIASCIFRIKQGYGPLKSVSRSEFDYEFNFLKMLFGGHESKHPVITPTLVEALKVLLILHADHEQNCSTSSVRLVGSSFSDVFASVSSGILALWGPLHGGANEKMIQMLQMIVDDDGNYQKYIDKAKNKEDSFRLMGFGHRVYRRLDPRARVIKDKCSQLFEELNIEDDLLEIAKKIERVALKDDYFIERKLYPNVDFYSGIIYRSMGIPLEMFTVLFAVGRLPGWVSHWKEMRRSNDFRIGRPRQIYTGVSFRVLS